MKSPAIKTALPGPQASKWISTDRTYVSPSYSRIYPLVVKKAQGVWVQDMDDNIFLDFTAGIAACATGHCHPRVVKAIKEQAERLVHMSGTDFYYAPQIALAEKLASLAPGEGDKKVYFGNSGAEAVEAAFKLARYHTRGELNIAFFGAFHGRTMGALSLTASKTIQKKHYYPFVPGITHIPYAYCYRCPYNLCYPRCGVECVRWVEDTLFRTTMPPEQVAAIFVEPIQGEGGYIVPPPEFHARLYEIARELLSRPDAAKLGGDKREVAILISDLRNFTSISESVSPEATITILNRYFSHMIQVIQGHRGIVVDFFGDGVLVFFDPLGGPIAPAIHQAVQCALEMQKEMGSFNSEIKKHGLPELAMGVGLNAGQVVVGNIGSEARAKYGIVGSAVNVTQRIQEVAKGGEVVLTESILQRAKQVLIINRSFELKLKGIRKPVKLHVVQP
ncbi:MAG: aminotransferase class III-fold pyridoxal phosphate-dependent enzyme [candidate division Zixibacteria bacterium]|nr:aminotransferase class III-fold pyridoxal phosphate-dependent enzyme [candidate division Zixibacteria bacterium]